MRILYTAGNRPGSDVQMSRIVEHLTPDHKVCVAAFNHYSQSVKYLDWTLESIYFKPARGDSAERNSLWNAYGHKIPQLPYVNVRSSKLFLKDVEKFEPDLIISDFEDMSAHIAVTLGVKLWYCSPVFLYDGFLWKRGSKRYSNSFYSFKQHMDIMPQADRIFVYSPFCDIKFRPILRNGREWVKPYYTETSEATTDEYENICILDDAKRFSILATILNELDPKLAMVSRLNGTFDKMNLFNHDDRKYKSLLSGCSRLLFTGETSYLADAMYNEKNICILPSIKDPEALLNALMIVEYKIGTNLGQVELMGPLIFDVIQEAVSNNLDRSYMRPGNIKYLHQHILA
jgi:hypothetical protein